MSQCTTCHFACSCREDRFAALLTDIMRLHSTRKQVDDEFYDELKTSPHLINRLLAGTFYKGVRFGSNFLKPDTNQLLEIRMQPL